MATKTIDDEYKPYIDAFAEQGLTLYPVHTGGGCFALWMKTKDDEGIFTLGPSPDDRYNGFEVISNTGDDAYAYEPAGKANLDLSVEETVTLLAPALKSYLEGNEEPLPGWVREAH